LLTFDRRFGIAVRFLEEGQQIIGQACEIEAVTVVQVEVFG